MLIFNLIGQTKTSHIQYILINFSQVRDIEESVSLKKDSALTMVLLSHAVPRRTHSFLSGQRILNIVILATQNRNTLDHAWLHDSR